MSDIKLSNIQFPLNEKIIDDNGNVNRLWKNELIKLQTTINILIKEYNTP